MKKSYTKIAKTSILFVSAAFIVSACSKKNPQSPGFEFMPDMYHSVGYDAYQSNPNFSDGTTAREPVDGTVPFQTDAEKIYNVLPYEYPNTNEGYAASVNGKSPLPRTEQNVKEGEKLFKIYCAHCHGENGKGDGKVGGKNPALIPPPYNTGVLATMPEGQLFFSITYGKGMMGPHKNLLSKLNRWKIVQYVQTLQVADAKPAEASSDSLNAGNRADVAK